MFCIQIWEVEHAIMGYQGAKNPCSKHFLFNPT